ncbi:carbon-nitrogen hydrolase family protein [Nocardioides bruguierae]|uniref:Carbon-nitrogen hydrolase family protein n=1 Tax=Nocardioides bruguierae TaxID=2945102 RepID=A0A9X2D5Z8_9ACTN|nr:carbon-nitrogen hydrolase family protein [Nocardioides bruguierae]MCM0620037.1 carbon-nitrogen hydrolase family protein [Nocardioides bruguierae]
MTRLVVAAGQAVPVVGDVAANVARAAEMTRQAAARGARLLVLPEAFLTGYEPRAFEDTDALPHEDDLAGDLLAPLRAAADAAEVHVLVSTPLHRSDGSVTLSLVLVGADGAAHAAYDKQHLDPTERAWFAPGGPGTSVVEVDGVPLGLAICYDSRFPEHAAAAAEAGALAYVVSAAYLEGSTRGRDVALAARALDTGTHVVMAGALGECGGVPITGGSSVWGPEGHLLASVADDDGALALAVLDSDVVAEVRTRQTMHADRRRS